MENNSYGEKLRRSLSMVFSQAANAYATPNRYTVENALKEIIENYNKKNKTSVEFSKFWLAAFRNAKHGVLNEVDREHFNFIMSENLSTLMKGFVNTSPYTFRVIYTYMLEFKTPIAVNNAINNSERYAELFNFATDAAQCYKKRLDKLVETCKNDKQLHNILYKQDILAMKNEDKSYYSKLFLEGNDNKLMYEDIFAARFIEDTVTNTNLNIQALKVFFNNYENKITKSKKQDFNKIKEFIFDFSNLKSCNFKNFKAIYEKYSSNQINFTELFYNCFNAAKQITAKDYVKSCTDITKFETMEIDGYADVKVYNCGKKPFKMFISCLGTNRKSVSDSNTKSMWRKFDFLSCSFVSDKSLYSFRDLNSTFTFGFMDFDPNAIQLINSFDNYSRFEIGSPFNEMSSIIHPSEFIKPNEMLDISNERKSYNEVSLLSPHNKTYTKNENPNQADRVERIPIIQPSCIFCLNDITEAELKLAQSMNMPIFYAESQSYQYGQESKANPENRYDRHIL